MKKINNPGRRPGQVGRKIKNFFGGLNNLQKGIIVLIGMICVGTGVAVAAQRFIPKKAQAYDYSVIQSNHMSAEELDEIKQELTLDLDKELISQAFPDISWEYLDSSLPIKNRERVEAAGFSTALTFPFSGASQADNQAYGEDVIQGWWQGELTEELLRNVVYGPAVAKALAECKLSDGTSLSDLNPWLGEFIERYDGAFGEDGYGNAIFLEKDQIGKICVTSEYRHYAVGVRWLLDRFVKVRVGRFYSVRHWGLPPANDLRPTQVRAEVFEEPEDRDTLIAVFTDKSGNDLLVFGFNIHDKRPMIPTSRPEPKPEQTPAAESSPQQTEPTPTRGPDPKPRQTTAPTPKPRQSTPAPTKGPDPKPRQTTAPTKGTDPRPLPTEPTTPAPTKPTQPQTTAPTKPSQPQTTAPETSKERNHAPNNGGGEQKGGGQEWKGTNALEPDPAGQTGKGHGDPAKQTPATPTQRQEHKDATVKQVDQNTMNYQTQPARTNSYQDTAGSKATIGANHDAEPNGEFTPED